MHPRIRLLVGSKASWLNNWSQGLCVLLDFVLISYFWHLEGHIDPIPSTPLEGHIDPILPVYMWVGRIGSMCPSSFAPGFPMHKLWKSSQNHAKCYHRWVSCGLSCWGGAQSMRSLRVSKPRGPIILWGWVFIPTFPNEFPWFGFCLMWKLELVWWVFGLVLWSWGFEPDSFLNESFWLSFCLVWKLELICWVLGLVL